MIKFLKNTMAILLCWGIVLVAGGYVTYVQKPQEVERLKNAEKVERLKRAEVTSLLQEEAASQKQARQAVRRWRSRYKLVPDTMTTPAVVNNINKLTQRGFKNFDISFSGMQRSPKYNSLSYDIQGRGYYSSLYNFVWEIENSRDFYRLSDLKLEHIDLITENKETGRERMQVMVSFTMRLKSYFGGQASLRQPEEKLMRLVGNEGNGLRSRQELIDVPKALLPDEKPAVNPFFPGVLDKLPPNTHGRLDVEAAELISIVDGKAVFKDKEGYRSVGEGGAVYLGQVTEVDPRRNRVVARLNRGGIIDEVVKTLDTGEPYRQAQGSNQLLPTK